MESTGSLLQNFAKYLDYVVIISVNSYHDISLTANMPWEFISNASNGVIEAKRPILDRECTRLCARELQMRFSPFETLYPRHAQRPITLAVCV